MKNWWKIIIAIGLIAGGVWLFRVLTTPPPGVAVEDQGREHVTPEEVAKTAYKSNPPASGPHLPTWVKPGIYTEPQQEGELIHSLEHGYVIISYNCGAHLTENFKSQNPKSKQISNTKFQISKIYAHEEPAADEASAGEGSPSSNLTSEPIATGSAITDTESCKTLQQRLADLANRKKLWKLIVVPRPQLDTTIALTAWDRIDKFDPPAGGLDAERIEAFVDYFRDHGPEKTME